MTQCPTTCSSTARWRRAARSSAAATASGRRSRTAWPTRAAASSSRPSSTPPSSVRSARSVSSCAWLTHASSVVAAAAFYGRPLGGADVTDLANATELLKPALGATASTLFAVALLAAGQQATLTSTLAGQVVLEGFLGRGVALAPWARRLATRAAASASWCIARAKKRGPSSLFLSRSRAGARPRSRAGAGCVSRRRQQGHGIPAQPVAGAFFKIFCCVACLRIVQRRRWCCRLRCRSPCGRWCTSRR